MDKRQIVGLAGSTLLALGLFAPLITVPVYGSMNIFSNGRDDGALMLVLAVVSMVLVLFRNFRWLWLTAIIPLLLIIYAGIEMRALVRSTGVLASTVHIEWGWALLVIGVALLLSAAADVW